ncbi:MAG: hypothetical protein ACE5DI_04445 [Candidatus Micrarchaeia archaeon]
MRFFLSLFALFLLASFAFAYTDHSLSVNIILREDGTAHVTEHVIFSADSSVETVESNQLLSRARSVSELSKLSQNLRFHIGPSGVGRSNIRITTRPAYDVASTARSIILDYDTSEPVANISKNGRLTSYVFSQEFLLFEKTSARQMLLGPIMELSVELPPDASIGFSLSDRKLLVGPEPYVLFDNKVTWSGRNIGQMVGYWYITYEREERLSKEVYDFFFDLYQQAASLLPLLFLGGLAFFVALIFVKIRKH